MTDEHKKQRHVRRQSSRQFANAEKYAIGKARCYLWGRFQAYRLMALRQVAAIPGLTKRERFLKSWRCVNSGGLLPFAKDEILPSSKRGMSFMDYEPYLQHFLGQDAQNQLFTWLEEGMAGLPGFPEDEISEQPTNDQPVTCWISREKKPDLSRFKVLG